MSENVYCLYLYMVQKDGETTPPIAEMRDELRQMADTWTDEQFLEYFSLMRFVNEDEPSTREVPRA